MKCPRCNNENIFKYNFVYTCTNCGCKFIIQILN